MISSLDYEEVRTYMISKYGSRIIKKNNSFLMKTINVILIVLTLGMMRRFMTGFITTLGEVVYVPEDWDTRPARAKAIVLRHEMVHMSQKARMGTFLFVLSYLFWIFPVGLAKGRRDLEAEAYEESMSGWAQAMGVTVLDDENFKEGIIGHFMGPSYFWMWPFRKSMETWYTEVVQRIKSRKFDGEPILESPSSNAQRVE